MASGEKNFRPCVRDDSIEPVRLARWHLLEVPTCCDSARFVCTFVVVWWLFVCFFGGEGFLNMFYCCWLLFCRRDRRPGDDPLGYQYWAAT